MKKMAYLVFVVMALTIIGHGCIPKHTVIKTPYMTVDTWDHQVGRGMLSTNENDDTNSALIAYDYSQGVLPACAEAIRRGASVIVEADGSCRVIGNGQPIVPPGISGIPGDNTGLGGVTFINTKPQPVAVSVALGDTPLPSQTISASGKLILQLSPGNYNYAATLSGAPCSGSTFTVEIGKMVTITI